MCVYTYMFIFILCVYTYMCIHILCVYMCTHIGRFVDGLYVQSTVSFSTVLKFPERMNTAKEVYVEHPQNLLCTGCNII